VLISTHFSGSGLEVPSFNPGISLNCLLTSAIINEAVLPTASIVIEAKRNGNIPPIKIPIITMGFVILITLNSTDLLYAVNKAKAVNAAEPIANPFPIAAVVLPTASKESVISLTSGFNPAISAIPPALSAIGP